jgi:hypothetical protein
MRVKAGLWILSALVVLGVPREALGCSCIARGPACQAFWTAHAIFDATVVAIEPVSHPEGVRDRPFLSDLLVTLDVHRGWKGVQPGPLRVTTASNDAACGYSFERGRRYLVFASTGSNGGLVVSLCSATLPFDGSGPVADFLASLEAPEQGGRIFGTVRTFSRSFTAPAPGETPTDTEVTLIGPAGRRTAASSGGRYEFTALDAGSYRVELKVPEGHGRSPISTEVEIVNRRACAEANFSLTPAGQISGRLVGADGRSLSGVRVEVTSPDARPHPDYGLHTESSMTDKDGHFDLRALPAGRYIVGVNLKDLPNNYNPYARTVFPGGNLDPQVIVLGLGEVVDLGIWHMPPPLPVVRVAGIVVRTDGVPVGGVYVGSWDRTGDPVERARGAGGATTGGDGRFVLDLREGRVYTFTVRGPNNGSLRISAPRLDTSQAVPALIRIVVETPQR